MHGREVLAEAAPARPDGDDVRHSGSRGPDAAQLGPRVVDRTHRTHRRQRHPDIAVHTLGLLQGAQVQYQLVTVDFQVSHACRV